MTLRIPPELEERFVAAARAAGREPEVALAELLDEAVERQSRKLAALRDAIDEADASPDAADGAFDRVRERLGLPKR